MAKTYQMTSTIRLVNKIMHTLVRWGIGPKQTYILTVPGRQSGKLYSTPVSLVKDGADRWLVAPYGEVSWVKNARAAGQVTLTRGKSVEIVTLTEVSPAEGAPVLKQYINLETITRPYFNVEPDAPLEAFAAEAARHPVFHVGNVVVSTLSDDFLYIEQENSTQRRKGSKMQRLKNNLAPLRLGVLMPGDFALKPFWLRLVSETALSVLGE